MGIFGVQSLLCPDMRARKFESASALRAVRPMKIRESTAFTD